MKIFSWMQTKLERRQEKKRPSVSSASGQYASTSYSRKEEFSDWPETLLAIGTFGSNKAKEDDLKLKQDNSQPSQDNFTLEEVNKLTKELTNLLSRTPKTSTNRSEEGTRENTCNQPLDMFLNCPSSLEADQTTCGSDLSTEAKIALNKGKNLMDDKGAIRQRSLSFLLRKMFACYGGSPPTSSLRDPFQESRMEKILRTLLHKKIYPQGSLQPLAKRMLERQVSTKKLFEIKPEERLWLEELATKEDGGSKWVKTDSEYIVLEI